MKKSFLIMITLVCCLALAAGILTACNSNEGTQTGGQDSGWSSSSDGVISIAGGTIDGEEIFMLVESSVDSVSLASRVKCAEGMIWRLYHDSLGQQEIPTKIAAGKDGELDDGDNVFYIVVTSTDATQVSVYSLTIHRSYAASISFYDGDELLYTDTAYTGREYVVDYTPDIPGCVFHNWETADGNECSSFMLWGAVSLYANRTANVYKATLGGVYDSSVDGRTVNITFGEAFAFLVPQRFGYTFSGWYVGDEQLTSSDGRSLGVWSYTSDQTVTAKWQANPYAVALQTGVDGGGEVSGAGNYGYASPVSIQAEPYLGYEFAGWYDGDKLVSKQSSYTFSLPAKDVTYIAKFVVKDEMSNYSFTSTFDECTITGIKDKTVTDIIIPDYVTYIYSSVFSDCNNITSATMPTFAIDYIPQDSLQTVVLTSGESIGYGAFRNCSNLTSVTIPDSVTSIGWNAFDGCSSLTFITIGKGVTSIGEDAFANCSSLTAVNITDIAAWCGINFNLSSGGSYCFSNPLRYANNLYLNGELVTDLEIPDSVTSIGEYAFYDCGGLTSVTIPDSVTSIGDHAFDFCTSLTSVTIGDGVTSIGDHAFHNCYNLTSVTIPDSVTSIGKYAFNYCPGLTSVTIGKGVTSIGYYAFYNCSGLTAVYITDIDAWCGIEFDSTFSNPLNYAHNLYLNGELVTDLVIPDSVTSIGGVGVFQGCSGLTSITIPDSVTSIGGGAFRGCTADIIWGDDPKITEIGTHAFSGYRGTSITIPDSVTSIEDDAFEDCYKLVEVYNKSSLNIVAGSTGHGYVGYYAKNVYTEEGGSWFTDTADGFRFFYDGEQGYLMGYYGSETAIDLPASFTAYDGALVESYAIYKYAFEGCSSLTFVTIPDSVTSIGEDAFEGCSSLTSITIPDSVTSIGEDAFYGCSSLESITIPFVGATKYGTSDEHFGYIFGASSYDSNYIYVPTLLKEVVITGGTSIDDYAFYGCSGLTSVTIPDSVTRIGIYAFDGCSSLTSVTFEVTTGWYYTSYSTATGGTSLSSSDLSIPSTAAKWLTSTYDGYYWNYRKRNV